MARFPTWVTIGEAAEGAYLYSVEQDVSEVTIVAIIKGPGAGRFTVEADWLPPDVAFTRCFRINFAPEPARLRQSTPSSPASAPAH